MDRKKIRSNVYGGDYMSICERHRPTENGFSDPPPFDRPFGSEAKGALGWDPVTQLFES